MKNSTYKILPFKFTRISNKELLVNEVGDYLFAPNGTVELIVSGNLSTASSLYRNLLAKYIIADNYQNGIIDILSTRIRTKKSFLDHFTALHIFVLTLRCNQKCIYCQASSHDRTNVRKDMKIEYLDKAIDLMLKSPNPFITMEFQGGESSLVPELMEYAIIETEKRNKQLKKCIQYVICTNLVKIDDKLLDLCERYKVFISTSLDGPESVHNHNRGSKNSYQDFVFSLQKIKSRMGLEMVSPLMTTSEYSLNYPNEIVDSYRDLGFHSIFLRPLNPYGRAKENEDWHAYTDDFIKFYRIALEYILSLNMKGELFVENFTAFLMKKILTPFPISFVDLQSPAGIINSVIVYNYDGYVYCSDESRMLAEQGDLAFRLGSVNDKYEDIFYGRKAQQLSKLWATEYIAGCSDCAFQQYCGADPVRNYTTQGDAYGFRPSSNFCKLHKEIFKYLFELIDKKGDEVLPIFRSWVYG